MGKVDLTERIRQRAYETWESQGRPHGLDQVHWLHAEAEIREGLKAPEPTEKTPKPTTKPLGKSVPSSRPPLKSPNRQPPKK